MVRKWKYEGYEYTEDVPSFGTFMFTDDELRLPPQTLSRQSHNRSKQTLNEQTSSVRSLESTRPKAVDILGTLRTTNNGNSLSLLEMKIPDREKRLIAIEALDVEVVTQLNNIQLLVHGNHLQESVLSRLVDSLPKCLFSRGPGNKYIHVPYGTPVGVMFLALHIRRSCCSCAGCLEDLWTKDTWSVGAEGMRVYGDPLDLERRYVLGVRWSADGSQYQLQESVMNSELPPVPEIENFLSCVGVNLAVYLKTQMLYIEECGTIARAMFFFVRPDYRKMHGHEPPDSGGLPANEVHCGTLRFVWNSGSC